MRRGSSLSPSNNAATNKKSPRRSAGFSVVPARWLLPHDVFETDLFESRSSQSRVRVVTQHRCMPLLVPKRLPSGSLRSHRHGEPTLTARHSPDGVVLLCLVGYGACTGVRALQPHVSLPFRCRWIRCAYPLRFPRRPSRRHSDPSPSKQGSAKHSHVVEWFTTLLMALLCSSYICAASLRVWFDVRRRPSTRVTKRFVSKHRSAGRRRIHRAPVLRKRAAATMLDIVLGLHAGGIGLSFTDVSQ